MLFGTALALMGESAAPVTQLIETFYESIGRVTLNEAIDGETSNRAAAPMKE